MCGRGTAANPIGPGSIWAAAAGKPISKNSRGGPLKEKSSSGVPPRAGISDNSKNSKIGGRTAVFTELGIPFPWASLFAFTVFKMAAATAGLGGANAGKPV